jgi:hypothetical protein
LSPYGKELQAMALTMPPQEVKKNGTKVKIVYSDCIYFNLKFAKILWILQVFHERKKTCR